MPIGVAGNPVYNDFTNPENPPVTQTHQVLAKLSDIRKASPESGFNGDFNLTLNHQLRSVGSEQFPPVQTAYFYQRTKNKADLKRNWHGVSIGRFGRKGNWSIFAATRSRSISMIYGPQIGFLSFRLRCHTSFAFGGKRIDDTLFGGFPNAGVFG